MHGGGRRARRSAGCLTAPLAKWLGVPLQRKPLQQIIHVQLGRAASPSKIASTISRASSVKRRTWLTYVLPIPFAFARSSSVACTPSSSCFRQRNARASALTIGVVDPRPRHPRCAVRLHNQLPSATLPEGHRMWTAIVSPSAEIVARFMPPPPPAASHKDRS